jgi:flavin reductase (DIM6/NTAB) family NADH-FMN oxidoreductase RutF
MDVDFGEIGEYERYKLMASLIVPRPIALVTTVSRDHVVNAAPFSMFCMLGEEPPLVLISLNRGHDGTQKDTARNIDASREFVVHMVDEDLAEAADRCGERLAAGESETERLGLRTIPSRSVLPPTLVAAPVAFECVLHEKIDTSSREIYLGRVLSLHTRDQIIDTDAWRVRLSEYFPVARFGASFYTTTRDRFSLTREPAGSAVTTRTAVDEL